VRLSYAGSATPLVVARVDGVEHPMRLQTPGCRAACVYETGVPLGATTLDGAHAFSFRAEAGGATSLFPASGTLPGPLVVAGAPPPPALAATAAFALPDATLGYVLVLAFALALALALVAKKRRGSR
jgi:hypothetical protein